jgi:hypothetical protein
LIYRSQFFPIIVDLYKKFVIIQQMPTKIIPSSSRMNTQEIEGTVNSPAILPLSHSEINHASIADHGEFAVFTASDAIHIGRTDYTSIVLNEKSPVLDLKEKGIYLDSAYQRFEFTKGSRGGKERG